VPHLCRDIMTPDPASCRPDQTALEVAQLMRARNVGSVPVVENRDTMTLVGIVTDRDLTMKVIAGGRDPETTSVREVMSPNPITCAPDEDIQRALETMARSQVRRLPVVESGRLIGIIALADIATRLHAPADTADLVEQLSREWRDIEQITREWQDM
jgi:CBS domain-containing protein